MQGLAGLSSVPFSEGNYWQPGIPFLGRGPRTAAPRNLAPAAGHGCGSRNFAVTQPIVLLFGGFRSARDGSWHSEAAYCRAAYRAWNTPDGRTQFIGFRLALAPKVAR